MILFTWPVTPGGISQKQTFRFALQAGCITAHTAHQLSKNKTLTNCEIRLYVYLTVIVCILCL